MNLNEKVAHIYTEKLTSKHKAKLKSLAHALKPVVQLGEGGFSENVIKEIKLSLEKHELIKVQLGGGSSANEKEEALQTFETFLPEHAHMVSRIGRTVILHLEKTPKKAKILLKDL